MTGPRPVARDGGQWPEEPFPVRSRVIHVGTALVLLLLAGTVWLTAQTVARADQTPRALPGTHRPTGTPVWTTGTVESCRPVGPVSWSDGLGDGWRCAVRFVNHRTGSEIVVESRASLFDPDDVGTRVRIYARCESTCTVGGEEPLWWIVVVQAAAAVLRLVAPLAALGGVLLLPSALPRSAARRWRLRGHSPRGRVAEIRRLSAAHRVRSDPVDPDGELAVLASPARVRAVRRAWHTGTLGFLAAAILTTAAVWWLPTSTPWSIAVTVLTVPATVVLGIRWRRGVRAIREHAAERYVLRGTTVLCRDTAGERPLDLHGESVHYDGPDDTYRRIAERGFDSRRPMILPPLSGRYDVSIVALDADGRPGRVRLASRALRTARGGAELRALAAVLAASPHERARADAARLLEQLAMTERPFLPDTW